MDNEQKLSQRVKALQFVSFGLLIAYFLSKYALK